MHPIFGILLIAAAGFAYLRFGKPLADAQRESAALIPDEVQLRRQAGVGRALLTFFLLLAAAVLLWAAEMPAAAIGGAAVLAALWSPWAGLRILAAFAVLAIGALAALAALFIAAGGPDSRGGNIPGAAIFLLGGVAGVLLVVGMLIRAEVLLLRLKGAEGREPPDQS